MYRIREAGDCGGRHDERSRTGKGKRIAVHEPDKGWTNRKI